MSDHCFRCEGCGWKPTVQCEDCGRPYSQLPLDVILSDEQWARLTGRTDGGGILCADCILVRAARLGATAAKMHLDLP